MKKKLFFRTSNISTKEDKDDVVKQPLSMLIKVDVAKDEKDNEEAEAEVDVFEDDGSELSIEELEEQVRQNEMLLKRKTKIVKGDISINEKPPKQKVAKRDVVKGVVMFDRWSPIVKKWADTKGFKENDIVSEFEIHSDRIDVVSTEGKWRICAMGCIGEEFTITLYYDYEYMYNSRCIEIRYIHVHEIENALNYVFNGMELFKRKNN